MLDDSNVDNDDDDSLITNDDDNDSFLLMLSYFYSSTRTRSTSLTCQPSDVEQLTPMLLTSRLHKFGGPLARRRDKS